MGQQHEVDRLRVEIKRLAVSGRSLASALDHAAVHQKARVGALDKKAGTGHFAGGAEEVQFHGEHLCLPFGASEPVGNIRRKVLSCIR